jgi:hypothetical protein
MIGAGESERGASTGFAFSREAICPARLTPPPRSAPYRWQSVWRMISGGWVGADLITGFAFSLHRGERPRPAHPLTHGEPLRRLHRRRIIGAVGRCGGAVNPPP